MLATHKGRWPAELESKLERLERMAGTRAAQRSMTFAELEDFARLPTIDLGVHTRTHPVLPLVSDEDLAQEIGTAFDVLRERFEKVIPVLALPFGLFDRRTLVAGRRAGMLASLTLAGTTLRDYGGRDDLPRFCICRHDSAIKLRVRLTGLLDPGRWWRPTAPRFPLLPSPTS
jgi:peptidoglycan/xylan/chitin deacetylase (PgdA/CDA1 family)